ncbi:SDR family NAD(P)-dependent oxidoreductase [Candidatus Pelagibacter sp.]|jgi:retinol dehydrogenase 12|nr:SDR family NAD(P)-dependent oxidoreductase [Candidatus Pelagibacter sp.]
MSKKNIIITGGTDGVGLALAKRLIEDEYKVFIIGKNETKGNNAVKNINSNKVEFFQCDLSEKQELINLAKKLMNLNKIDCLVNNAGAIFEKREVNNLGVEKTFALNHLSYFHLSMLLINKLEESDRPKIINVSSFAHKRYNLNLNDLENKKNYNSMKAYCQSKLLNIFFTYAFNQKIKSKITCNCLCPGLVNSNLRKNNSSLSRLGINILKNLFAISSNEASKVPYHLITSQKIENVSGKYFIKFKQAISSDYSKNKLIASKVWNKSLNYIE